MKINNGFRPDIISPEDFTFGDIALEDRNPSGNWFGDLPTDEAQSNQVAEYMDCVSQAADNCLETQGNFLQRIGRIPQGLINWLKSNGYIDDQDHWNFNDAFTAKVSKTTHNGNSMKPVWDAIRHNGLLPEGDWHKTSDNLTWDEYYEEIPQNLKDKALTFWKFFDISYQWIVSPPTVIALKTLQDALKHAPLHLASPTCDPWAGGVIPACVASANHATEIYGVDTVIHDFDTYDPYKKKLALDYPLMYLMQGILTPKTFELTQEMARFIWNKRTDIKAAFPTVTNLCDPHDPTYSIYDWCRQYGPYEEPDVFIDGKIDYAGVDELLKADKMPPVKEDLMIPFKKNSWFAKVVEAIINYFKNLFQ